MLFRSRDGGWVTRARAGVAELNNPRLLSALFSDDVIKKFQKELAAMGYKFQFVTLAGFHALNLGMFNLAAHAAQLPELTPAFLANNLFLLICAALAEVLPPADWTRGTIRGACDVAAS